MNDDLKAIDSAIRNGDVEGTKALLFRHSDLLHFHDGAGTWLHTAASKDNVEMITMLIQLGCKVDADIMNDRRSRRPLARAVQADLPRNVEVLLENGADPNHSRTVISAIVGLTKHSLEMIKLLEMHGADLHRVFLNEFTNQPMNALSVALDWGKDDVAKYLRSKGAVLPEAKPQSGEVKTLKDEIVAYFTEQFGNVQSLAFVEIVPTDPPIAVNIIPATKDRNHVTLFTTGMSERPMNVPEEMSEFQYAELFIQLPSHWKMTQTDDPDFLWPIHWLRMLAKAPHLNETSLGPYAIVPNGSPPKPLTDHLKFDSMLALAEKKFTARDGKRINFYRLLPLYPEERALVDKMDIRALLRSFDRRQISFVFDAKRNNAAI